MGLDANALLGGEVEALGKRLEDVRESLTQLADVAEGKVKAKNEAKNEINGQRTFLDSVQKVNKFLFIRNYSNQNISWSRV